jgi:hypothetical protein
MRVLLLLLVPLLQLAAQSWEALSPLRPGDKIRVLEIAGAEHKGAFSSFTAQAITLRTGSGELSVERSRVRRIQVRGSSRRIRNLAIGAAIGVAVGVTVDQTLGAYLRNEAGESTGTRAVTYVAPIALFGGIAAAFPAYRTVYRVR